MSRRVAVIVALFAVLIAVVAAWSVRENVQRDALLEMPAQARGRLYERTLHTLQVDCDPAKRPRGLDTYCADQAAFIQQFPECDQACKALVQPYQKKATR